MRRPTTPDHVLWDAALAGGARRGLFLLPWGAAIFGVGLAWRHARRFEDSNFEPSTFVVVWGAACSAMGMIDAVATRMRRRAWTRRGTPAWHLEPTASVGETVRRRRLVSSSASWHWLLVAVPVSAAVSIATAAIGGKSSGWPILAVLSAAICGAVYRATFGDALVRARFPRTGMVLGATSEVSLLVDPARCELSRESFACELRCVRAKRPLLGILPRREVVAIVDPLSIRPADAGGLARVWWVAFHVPADLPPADLLADPPVYWEIGVEAYGPRAAYLDAFLAPVFTPSSAAEL